ncbi:hypothetical protein [Microlunatus sp. Y2014]
MALFVGGLSAVFVSAGALVGGLGQLLFVHRGLTGRIGGVVKV